MPVFSLTGARGSQENTEAGKQYNFLTEDEYYRVTAKIKNLKKRSSNR